MERNSRCGISDHAIATLSLMQLQMAPESGFQAALNLAFSTFWLLDFVTQIILFQKYLFFLCVTDSLDRIHDIHCYCPSGVFESLQHCCTDFSAAELTPVSSRESFVMASEGRTKSCCLGESWALCYQSFPSVDTLTQAVMRHSYVLKIWDPT